jgi:Winged helix-turn helix
VLTWLQTKEYWNLPELQAHIQDEYQIVFDSKQSYYTLFKDAGMSWKNFQKCNPKADPELAQKKSEITDWLDLAVKSSLVNWWSFSKMNVICCGETCAATSRW